MTRFTLLRRQLRGGTYPCTLVPAAGASATTLAVFLLAAESTPDSLVFLTYARHQGRSAFTCHRVTATPTLGNTFRLHTAGRDAAGSRAIAEAHLYNILSTETTPTTETP